MALWRGKWIAIWKGKRNPSADSIHAAPLKLVAGLGNPGQRYRLTPHNLGFEVVNRLAQEASIQWEGPINNALLGCGMIGQIPLLLAKPQNFMNLSGQAIADLLHRHGLTQNDLVVFCDDLALPMGRLRIRTRGSSGGHKGLESIIAHLGTEQFTRVRLGIAPDEPYADAAEYVLSPILPRYRDRVEKMVLDGSEALKMVLSHGVEAAMNEYNR